MLAIVVLGLFSGSGSGGGVSRYSFSGGGGHVGYPWRSPSVVESGHPPAGRSGQRHQWRENIRLYSLEGSSVVVVEFVLTIDPNRAGAGCARQSGWRVGALSPRNRRAHGQSGQPQRRPDDDGDCRLGQRQLAHAGPPTPTRWCASACKPCPAWAKCSWWRRQAASCACISTLPHAGAGAGHRQRVNALRNANQGDFPAGRVQDINRDYLVRLSGKLASPEAFGQITVGVRKWRPSGWTKTSPRCSTARKNANSLALINGQRAVHRNQERAAPMVDTSAGGVRRAGRVAQKSARRHDVDRH